jgi:hypothetical protein
MMAIAKITKEQIAEIFKRVVGRDPDHNDYPAIVGLSKMDGMTAEKVEEFFAPLRSAIFPQPVEKPQPVQPVSIPAPVQVVKTPVNLAPAIEPKPQKVEPAHTQKVEPKLAAQKVEPKPEVKTETKPASPAPVKTPAPVHVVNPAPAHSPAHPATKPTNTWDDEKTPVDFPAVKKPTEKKLEKHSVNATIPSRKKGKK